MKTILFVNSCVNQDTSRTLRLADAVLDKMLESEQDDEIEIVEVSLEDECIDGISGEMATFRGECSKKGDFSHEIFEYAKQFAEADEVIIAAPYWDLSFPTMLKAYVEQICVNGITFHYSEEGIPKGLCKAKKMTYVTTAGGPVFDYNMGYDYIAAICKLYFGFEETECVIAEGLDVWGNDPEAILADAIAKL